LADNLHLKVITPLALVVDEQVELVEGPGELGEFGILPGHVPFLTTLSPGFLKFKQGSETKSLIIPGGLAEVSDDNVRILTDSTEDPSAIDTSAAKEDIYKLESLIVESQGDEEKLKELNHQLKIAQVRASAK
jgi:F-type H+-transporting ATPase subunit epsilon